MNINSGQVSLLCATKLNKTLGRLTSWLLLWIIVTLFGSAGSLAQGYVIDIQPGDSLSSVALKKIANRSFSDSSQAVSVLKQVVSSLQMEGYILAGFHDLSWQHNTVSGRLTAGVRQFLSIRQAGSDKELSSWKDLESKVSLNRELESYLNAGHPFARIYFREVVASQDTLIATLEVEKGPKIVFDSLILSPTNKTKPRFLQRYLFVSAGTPYCEKAFQGIKSRINNSGYLRTSSAPEVDFYAGKARIDIKLEELHVNQIDGVIGFLPDQNSETGKLLLTGQIETDLYNLFGSGKHIYLNWQSFNIASQQLNFAYDHPVILGSPLDFNGTFQQLKQDSSFVTRTVHAGFLLPIGYTWKLGFGVDYRQNSLLTSDAISSTEKLSNADSKLNQFGISMAYSQLDDILLPTNGISSGMKLGVGQKEITKNSAVDPNQYAEVDLQSMQTTMEGYFESYFKASKSTVFAQQVYAGSIINKQVFQNDLFRFGGLARLRGFNENQFYSQHYGVVVAELRFMLQEQSYFVSFIDQGVINDGERRWLYALGVGGGMVLQVNNGIFRLMLGVGGTKDQPIDFTQPKVHFGFVNRF